MPGAAVDSESGSAEEDPAAESATGAARFVLDAATQFPAGVPMRVSGNTAALVREAAILVLGRQSWGLRSFCRAWSRGFPSPRQQLDPGPSKMMPSFLPLAALAHPSPLQLAASRYSQWFDVTPRTAHRGAFPALPGDDDVEEEEGRLRREAPCCPCGACC